MPWAGICHAHRPMRPNSRQNALGRVTQAHMPWSRTRHRRFERTGDESTIFFGLKFPDGGIRRGWGIQGNDGNPVQRVTQEPPALRDARRCGARTRSGSPCGSPIVNGKKRCRMHGGLRQGPGRHGIVFCGRDRPGTNGRSPQQGKRGRDRRRKATAAKRELGVKAVKDKAFQGGWKWEVPIRKRPA